MNELEKLKEMRQGSADKIAELKTSRKAIAEKVDKEDRKDFSAEEWAEYRELGNKIGEEQERFEDLNEQVEKREAEEKRSGRQDPKIQELSKPAPGNATVVEPLTYQPGTKRSWYKDFCLSQLNYGDAGMHERLRRHAIDVETAPEYRNLNRTDGTGGFAVPPVWLMNQFIELARAGRVYANLAPTEALPAGTDSINIPKIQTGTTTGIQTADNATVSETDLTDTSVQANVQTIAGAQGISLQLLKQSPINFDEIVFRDLAHDYAAKLDLQVIGGTGSNGQVLGVRNTSGIQTVTATTGANNVTLVYAAIANAIQKVHSTRFLPPEVIVMHPQRWGWFQSLSDSNKRPLSPAVPGAFNAQTHQSVVASQGVVGEMFGLPVVVDPNLPTTVNTNQDVIHVLRASDLMLFEGGMETRALMETRANTLTVLLQIYGFLAFTAGRYPASIVEIGGSALSTPAFDGANG